MAIKKTYVNEVVGGDGKRIYNLVRDGSTIEGNVEVLKAYTPETLGSQMGAGDFNNFIQEDADYPQLNTDDKTVLGAINEVNSQLLPEMAIGKWVRSSAQSIPSNDTADTTVTVWTPDNTIAQDNLGVTYSGGVFTFGVAGDYELTAMLTYSNSSASGANYRRVTIATTNGYGSMTTPGLQYINIPVQTSVMLNMKAGDTATVTARQTTGAALNINVCEFTVKRLR